MREYGFLLLVLLQKILAFILIPYFWWCSRRPKKTVPKIDEKILFCSATRLAEKIRKKEVSSEEVIRAYIRRVKAVDPILKAVVQNRFEHALIEARNVDEFLKTSSLSENEIQAKFPLLGVPLTVKESCGVEGLSHSVGSKLREGIIAKSDSTPVKRLRDAGAIPLLISNTPELCLFWETSNLLREKTRNPYDTNRTSAGSSGGEGSLLGSGASVIGVGSDVAGSIRLPAMFNGIFGHKPTSRIITIDGHYPLSINDTLRDYLVIGPMARYAEDLSLMTKIMCDKNMDLNWDQIDISKLNVYHDFEPENHFYITPTQKDLKQAMYDALDCLRINGKSNVNDYKFDLTNICQTSLSVIYDMEDIPQPLQEGEENRNLIVEILKSLSGCSDYSLQALFFHALEKTNTLIARSRSYYYKNKAQLLKQDFMEKLGDDGVFLFPTYPTSAVLHNKLFVETTNVLYMLLFNVLGFPATHVPLGKDSKGLPIGIQVVAAPYQDRLCFAVAKELEKHFGGWKEP